MPESNYPSIPDDASLEELERMFPDIMRDWVWE